MEKKQPHPHAELMLQYAKEAAEDVEVYKNWEVNNHHFIGSGWEDLKGNPAWLLNHSYRRKPNTVMIGGIKVPAPETKELDFDQPYYYPFLSDYSELESYNISNWGNSLFDIKMLKRGLIHLDKEAAIAHAKALIALTKLQESI